MNKLNAIVLGSLLSVSALSAVNAAETTASATGRQPRPKTANPTRLLRQRVL